MPGNRRDVEVDIVGRDKSGPAFKSAAANAQKAESRIGKLKDGIGKLGAAGAAAATGLAILGKMLNDSVAQGLAKANARVALGTAAYAKLEAQAAKTAHSMGLTNTQYIKTGGQVAILTKNLGFSAEESARFGSSVVGLSSNLSIMSGKQLSTAEASDVLRSALAGEYDPLQAVGIAISANIVEQEKLNIKKKYGAQISDLQAGALAVEAIVARQTASATDVLSTAEGRNAQAIDEAKASMSELYDTISGKVLPILGSYARASNEMFDTLSNDEKTWAEKFVAVGNASFPWLTPLIDKIRGVGDAQYEAIDATDALAEAASASAAEHDRQAAAIERSRQAADKMANAQLGARGAARNYQAAIDEASEAIAKNGRGLDINTKRGRDNQAALDSIAEAANRQGAAILEAGESQAQFDAAMVTSREQLVAMGIRFGLTKQQAEAYATKVLSIPANVTTTADLDTKAAEAKIEALRAKLFRLEGLTANPKAGTAGQGLGVYNYAGATGAWAGRATGGGARTGGPTEVNVTNKVLLDGRPFYAMSQTIQDGAAGVAAWHIRTGRR